MTAIRTCPVCRTPFAGQVCPTCAADEERGPVRKSLKPGDRFRDLEILEMLGSGGMGVVFKARQSDPARVVALKICPPDKAEDPSFENRFLRESRTLASLSHPNIVQLLEAGKEQGLLFYTMELVDGVSLRQLLLARRPTPREAFRIVRQVCDGLQCAHANGIVHRDVKPENILIAPDFSVKIADFGLAKVIQGDSLATTATDGALGTPHYVAPEQMENPKHVDHRVDIYSTAVLLYEMLTGGLPVGAWEPPSGIDARVAAALVRALSKDPAKRFPDISSFRQAVCPAPRARLSPWPFVAAGVVGAAAAGLFVITRTGGRVPMPGGVLRVRTESEPERIPPIDAAKLTETRTLRGHSAAIHSIAWSPDGMLLASGGYKELILWKPHTGQIVQSLIPHQSWIGCVRFSPDGKVLATGSHDTQVKLWDVASGLLRDTLSGHHGKVLAVAFSPDGRTLASGGLDDEIRLWDVETAKSKFTIAAPGHQIASLAFHPRGDLLVSGGWDGRIRFWNPVDGKEVRRIERNSDHVSTLAFTRDGSTLVAGSWDGTVVLWDPRTGNLIRSLVKSADQHVCVSIHPAGEIVASGGFHKTAMIWRWEDGATLRELSGHTNHVFAVAFSPDGARLATGGADGIIKIWSARE